MADVRLMLAGLAACGSAGAQPQPSEASGVRPPPGWVALPPVAEAARAAAVAPDVTVVGVEAWGEPAMGCYALWIALRGAGSPEDTLQQIQLGIAAEKFTATDVVPSADGLALTVERTPYRGRVRVRLVADRIIALACVANERERAACEAACTTLLGAAP